MRVGVSEPGHIIVTEIVEYTGSDDLSQQVREAIRLIGATLQEVTAFVCQAGEKTLIGFARKAILTEPTCEVVTYDPITGTLRRCSLLRTTETAGLLT